MKKKIVRNIFIVSVISAVLIYTAKDMTSKPSIPAKLNETKVSTPSIKVVPREPTVGGVAPYYEGIDNWKHPTMEIKIKKVEKSS